MSWLKRNKYNLFSLLFLILVSLPALLPLTKPGFFVTDDGEWMIIRFSAFHQTLADGQLPVRFLGRLNQEYGYPVATFLYPGFMYLSEPIHLVGFSFVNSIKILLGLSIMTSGIFTYLWLRRFFDYLSSYIGAVVYLYTPYHLYDLYKRGSVGELLALSFLPFILWQIERRSLFWSSIGIVLLILSHNTLAGLFILFILCYIVLDLYKKRQKNHVLFYLFMMLFGLGMTAFFWMPIFFELHYTVFVQTNVSNWREYFSSASLIGYTTFLILAITFFNVITKSITIKKHRLTVLLFGVALLSIFSATVISTPFWQVVPVGFIQFPFRVLALLLICIAFLSAVNLSLLKGKRKIITSIAFGGLVLLSSVSFFQPTSYFDKPEGYYTTNMDTTTVKNEYMPRWVKEIPTQRAVEKVQIITGEGKIAGIVYNNKETNFVVAAQSPSTIRVNTVYWPGWKVFVANEEIPITYNNPKGLIEFVVPEGKQDVRLVFVETPLRLLSDVISLGSLFMLFFVSLKLKQVHVR